MAEHGHGHSVAAWTAVGVILLGSAITCLAVVLVSWPVAIAGIVIVIAGAVAGKVLAAAGYGQRKPSEPEGTSAIR